MENPRFSNQSECEDYIRRLDDFKSEVLKGYHKITGPFGECDCGYEGLTCAEQIIKKYGL